MEKAIYIINEHDDFVMIISYSNKVIDNFIKKSVIRYTEIETAKIEARKLNKPLHFSYHISAKELHN